MPTRPAASPPNACDSAVRCGTAVSGTRDSGTPTTNPATIAPTIHRWWMTVGSAQVDEDGDRRAGHAGVHALAGGRGRVHPVQREDEAARRDEVRELADAVHHQWRALPRLSEVLNIFSIRSVIRKPLTMLVIEANSAIAPRMRIRSG